MKNEIKQYDRYGELIKTFSTYQEASNVTGINVNTIKSATDEGKLCKSFYFQRDKEVDILPVEYIQQFTTLGKLEGTYFTISEIVDKYKPNVSRHDISHCISGGHKSMDYYWVKNEVILTEEEYQRSKIVTIVEQRDSGDNLVGIYWNDYDASRKSGILRSNINSVVRGKTKTAKGFKFSRVEMNLLELNQYLVDNNITF